MQNLIAGVFSELKLCPTATIDLAVKSDVFIGGINAEFLESEAYCFSLGSAKIEQGIVEIE